MNIQSVESLKASLFTNQQVQKTQFTQYLILTADNNLTFVSTRVCLSLFEILF